MRWDEMRRKRKQGEISEGHRRWSHCWAASVAFLSLSLSVFLDMPSEHEVCLCQKMRPLFFSFSPLDFFIKPFVLSFSSCLSPSTMVSVCSASLRLLCLFLPLPSFVWFCFFFLSFVSVNVVDVGVIWTFSKQILRARRRRWLILFFFEIQSSGLPRNRSAWSFRSRIRNYAFRQVFNRCLLVCRRKSFEVNRETFIRSLLNTSKNYSKDEVRRSSFVYEKKKARLSSASIVRYSFLISFYGCERETIELENDSIYALEWLAPAVVLVVVGEKPIAMLTWHILAEDDLSSSPPSSSSKWDELS